MSHSEHRHPVRPTITTTTAGGSHDGEDDYAVMPTSTEDQGTQRETLPEANEPTDAQSEGEQGDEEAQPVRQGSVPVKPTLEVREKHRITHRPYRRWCRHCQEGQAIGDGHKASQNEPLFPIIGVDYFYLTPGGEVVTNDQVEEGEESENVKCLMIRDRMTKCIFAMVIPQKGVDQDRWVVKQVVEAIEWLGHSKVLVKNDQERALVSLVREALKDLKVLDVGASEEMSARYDSQSNGATEVGVKLVRGPFRTLRLDLESRL